MVYLIFELDLYKHPHSGEQLNLKEAIQRGLIDGQSTVIENPSTGRFMTLKEALDGIRIDHEGQVSGFLFK